MIVKFNKVLPHPIKELNYSNSLIWDRDIEFNSRNKYLVKAPSGTGKTTFLSIIYAIRRDYDGTVTIDGKNVLSLSPQKIKNIRREHISIVFQGLKLFPELTAFENIEIKNKITQRYTKEEIYGFAERLGVLQLMERSADILSFGQRQRLALIRALCQPFDFLLLDEPFSHLDMDNASNCLSLICEECNKRGSGFILTTLGSDYGGNYDITLNL